MSPKTRWYSRVVGKKPPAMRSSWIRSIITTSAPSTASSMRCVTCARCSSPGGTSVGGPAITTEAPSLLSSHRFERATRLCRMSPTIATRSPLSRPFFCRIVSASSRACVGCSCAPSPAFTTEKRQWRASMCGAPELAWRMITMSGFIASRLRAVSSSVSPLVTLEAAVAIERLSAESTRSAISNEERVRVDGS